METSSISINVQLDDNKVPEKINWSAGSNNSGEVQQAKAFIISFWDGADKSALRIDIWTKEMMVDEMADFFYQTMMTMADTFGRATHQQQLAEEMKTFTQSFYAKFRDQQIRENK